MVKLLEGRQLAVDLQNQIKPRLKHVGSFEAILVGTDPGSILYLRKKQEMAESLGVKFRLHKFAAGGTTAQVVRKIHQFNQDNSVTGIMVQLPLPKGFDTNAIINAVDPLKDVDGLCDANIASLAILPATAEGIIKLMDHYKVGVRTKQVVLVGFTRLLNVSLSIYLSQMGADITILKSSAPNKKDLQVADIIITAAGRANLITGDDVKSGVVVIDVGANKYRNKLVGDVDFESVAKKAKAITPVPGGVGPMTVVCLYANLAKLVEINKK